MRLRGLFVAGTDTDVGKTVVAAGLLRWLRRRGVDAAPVKPVQSGAVRGPDGRLRAPDLDFALAAAGLNPTPEEWPDLCPFLFEPAASPHLAARLDRAPPATVAGVEAAVLRLAARREALVVEAAGGLLVPLNDDGETVLDLAARLGLPVLLVARSGLGTLNHSLLSLWALRGHGLEVAGVVLNDGRRVPGPDPVELLVREDNVAALARLGGARVLGPVPDLGSCDAGPEGLAWDRLDAVFAAAAERLLALCVAEESR